MGLILTRTCTCPVCGLWGAKIVWKSKDGKTLAIQCPHKHIFGTIKEYNKPAKPRYVHNLIFLVSSEK